MNLGELYIAVWALLLAGVILIVCGLAIFFALWLAQR